METWRPEGEVYLRKPCRAFEPVPDLLFAFLPLAAPFSARLAPAGSRMNFPATSSSCIEPQTRLVRHGVGIVTTFVPQAGAIWLPYGSSLPPAPPAYQPPPLPPHTHTHTPQPPSPFPMLCFPVIVHEGLGAGRFLHRQSMSSHGCRFVS